MSELSLVRRGGVLKDFPVIGEASLHNTDSSYYFLQGTFPDFVATPYHTYAVTLTVSVTTSSFTKQYAGAFYLQSDASGNLAMVYGNDTSYIGRVFLISSGSNAKSYFYINSVTVTKGSGQINIKTKDNGNQFLVSSVTHYEGIEAYLLDLGV